MILGVAAGAARCSIINRTTDERTTFVCQEKYLGAIIAQAAPRTDDTPEAAVIPASTVTLPHPHALPPIHRLDAAPPLVGMRVASIPMFGIAILGQLMPFVGIFLIGNMPSNPYAPVPSILPSLIYIVIAVLVILIVSAIVARLWMRRREADFTIALDCEAPKLGGRSIVTPTPKPKGTLGRWVSWQGVELPESVEPSYEETILTPDLPFVQRPAFGLVIIVPLMLFWYFFGNMPLEVVFALALLMVIGICLGSPALRDTLRGLHPSVDMNGLEIPRRKGEPERYEWATSALVIIGESYGATRLMLIDTQSDRRDVITITSKRLRDVLSALAASNA